MNGALLAYCPPYLQDMIVFAIHTGLRCGDIFDLKWEEVDFQKRRQKIVMQKSRKPLRIPLNDTAFSMLEAWHGMKKGPCVFYNHMDRRPIPRSQSGIQAGMQNKPG